jgi:hypothetical protein
MFSKDKDYYDAVRSKLDEEVAVLKKMLTESGEMLRFQMKDRIALEKFLSKLPKVQEELHKKIKDFRTKAVESYAEWAFIMIECFMGAILLAKEIRLRMASSLENTESEVGKMLASIFSGTPGRFPLVMSKLEQLWDGAIDPDDVIQHSMELGPNGVLKTEYHQNGEPLAHTNEKKELIQTLDKGVLAFLQKSGFDIDDRGVVIDNRGNPIAEEKFKEIKGKYNELYSDFLSNHFKGINMSYKEPDSPKP